MDQTTLLILGVVALVVAGAIVLALRRSWGGSLDRSHMPIQGVPDPRVANISDHTLREVQALVARGNKIEAIKRLRDLTGLGLKEAKDYVDSLPPIGPSGDEYSPDAEPETRPLAEAEIDELRALLARNKIEAIKRCREMTGLGLKEAKDFVESLPASGPVHGAPHARRVAAPQPGVSIEALEEVRALVTYGNKIGAIKRYRELTGLGLKEAKDFVDSL